MDNQSQFKEPLDVVKYLAGICDYYKPLEQAFQSILENTQYVDITELKSNIESLTKENQDLKIKTEKVSTLEDENKQQKDLIDSLGKQLATEKLTRLRNEGALSALGKEFTEYKLNAMKGVN